MTIEETIKSLQEQVKQDIIAADALQKAACYSQALFWAHLVLEKMCKALWIKKNNRIDYPYSHNLLKLFKESKVEITVEQKEFYAEMNQFQTTGRYDDSLYIPEDEVSKEDCEKLMERFKTEYQWIITQIQEK